MEEDNFYEDLVSKKDLKSGGPRLSVIFMVILMIAIVGFGAYVTYLKLKEEKEVEEKPTEEPPEVEEVESIDFDCDDTCHYTIRVLEKEVKIDYTVTPGQNEEKTHHIQIGGKSIMNKKYTCGGPATLKVLEDLLLISYHDGCDTTGNTIHIYKADGTEVTSYEYMDSSMRIESTNFDVSDNKIIVNGTRIYQGSILKLSDTKQVNICKQEEWASAQVDEDTLVSGTYEIQYMGNLTFKEPTLKNSKTLKDVYEECTIED